MALRYPDKKLWEVEIKIRKIAEFIHAETMPARLIQELDWLIPARKNLEQSINLAAPDYSNNNYEKIGRAHV